MASMLTALAVIFFISGLRPFAMHFKLVDDPDHRKRHGGSVPMIGGLAIYLSISLTLVTLNLSAHYLWLFTSSVIIVAVGALDDAFNLSVRTRFIWQIAASLIMIFGGNIWIKSLGIDIWSLSEIEVWLGIPFTIFSVVGLTNCFNMIDGIDGLASGQFLISLATIALAIALVDNSSLQLDWLILWFSAVFAFWLVNLSLTPIKPVFLGDAGSLLLGYIMSWNLIYYTQEPLSLIQPVAVLWCVTIPVFDTFTVITNRVMSGKSPFSSDRNHIHHIMVDGNIDSRLVLKLILGISATANLFGLWLTYFAGPLISLIVFCFLFLLFRATCAHMAKKNRGTKNLI